MASAAWKVGANLKTLEKSDSKKRAWGDDDWVAHVQDYFLLALLG